MDFEKGFGYAINEPDCVVDPEDCGKVVHTEPNSFSPQVGTLKFGEEIKILNVVEGEMWLNRNQYINPFGSFTDSVDDWFEIEGGGYVYSAFIFIPKESESSPFVSCENKWMEVNRTNQKLHVFCDGVDIFQAPVGVGLPGMETPLGENYTVLKKALNITMSDHRTYTVHNVLFNLLFTNQEEYIHLDWWHDDSYFGNEPTSHGCVGLQLHNAQWVWFFGFPGMKVKIYE